MAVAVAAGRGDKLGAGALESVGAAAEVGTGVKVLGPDGETAGEGEDPPEHPKVRAKLKVKAISPTAGKIPLPSQFRLNLVIGVG